MTWIEARVRVSDGGGQVEVGKKRETYFAGHSSEGSVTLLPASVAVVVTSDDTPNELCDWRAEETFLQCVSYDSKGITRD